MSVVGSGVGQPKRTNQQRTTTLALLENVLAPAGRYPAPPTNQLLPKECDHSMASNPTRTRASPAAASQSSHTRQARLPLAGRISIQRRLVGASLLSAQSANCEARSEHLFLCLLLPERARRGGDYRTVVVGRDQPIHRMSLVGHLIRRRPSPNASFGGFPSPIMHCALWHGISKRAAAVCLSCRTNNGAA